MPSATFGRLEAMLYEDYELPPDVPVSESARLEEDLGLDSLARLALVNSIEQEFGVVITDDKFDDIKTVGNVVAVIEAT